MIRMTADLWLDPVEKEGLPTQNSISSEKISIKNEGEVDMLK